MYLCITQIYLYQYAEELWLIVGVIKRQPTQHCWEKVVKWHINVHTNYRGNHELRIGREIMTITAQLHGDSYNVT